MTTQPTKKVRKAFALLMNPSKPITIQDAAKKAGCSRSAIYRSELYPAYVNSKGGK